MKQRTLLITLAALGIAVAGVLFMSCPPANQTASGPIASDQTVARSPGDFYYYVEGKQIPLTLLTDSVAVRFYDGVSEARQAEILLAETDLDPARDWRLTNPPLNISIVGAKESTDALGITAALANLNSASEVYWASPLLETRPGYAHVITDEFYISVPESVPDEDVLAFNKQMGVELVRRVDLSLIGLRGYYLRVTKATSSNSLDMANFYYENSIIGVTAAHPRFGFMYSRLASSTPNDPYYPETNAPGQWNLLRIGMPEAWDTCRGNSNIVVAVIDTGVELDYQEWDETEVGHEDFKLDNGNRTNQWINELELNGEADCDDDGGGGCEGNGYVDDMYGWDFADDDNMPVDGNGHGTQSAGIIAAVTNNETGVASIVGGWNGSPSGCKIMPIRVSQSPLTPDLGNLAASIEYAWKNGADIITMSLAHALSDDDVAQQIKSAREAGCLLVSAAYNVDKLEKWYPGAYPGVVCVGATNKCNAPPSYPVQRRYGSYSGTSLTYCNSTEGGPNPPSEWGSNWGWHVDIMAPGMKYWDTGETDWTYPESPSYIPNSYSQHSRTSSATPQVAGVAALVQSALLNAGLPLLSPVQMQATLQFSATDMVYERTNVPAGFPDGKEIAGPGRDIYTGYGLLNAPAALELALARPPFILRDGGGKHLMSIDNVGNLILEGRVVLDPNGTAINGELNDGHPDFVVTNSGTPPVVQLLISDEKATYGTTGLSGQNLYIRGTVHAGETSLSPPASGTGSTSFVVRNNEDAIVAYFDNTGNVYLKGHVVEGTDPDPGPPS